MRDNPNDASEFGFPTISRRAALSAMAGAAAAASLAPWESVAWSADLKGRIKQSV